MEFEALNKIYSNTVDDIIEVGAHNLCMYSREDLDEAQVGFRVDAEGNKLDNWIGDEYFVIGYDSGNGNPIIVKVDEEQIPVYTMKKDNKKSLRLIVDTYDEFIDILKLIEATNLYKKEDCQNLLIQTYVQIPDEAHNFWTLLIAEAYEFYTDDKFDTYENDEYEAESEEEFLI